MEMPVFSIIIPTYNRPIMLSRAIRSVLAQTFTDFELIVVNDAGQDDPSVLIESFKDERTIYLCRDKNGGLSAARNTGIRQARGRYITFLDDDDEYLPEFLEKTHDVLLSSGHRACFAWCGVRVVQDTAEGEQVVREKNWHPQSKDSRQVLGIGAGYGLTIHRACLDRVGLFDESFRVAEDVEFLFRLVKACDFAIIPDVLVKLHEHAGPRVKLLPERAAALEEIMQRNEDYLAQNPGVWGHFLSKAGVAYYRVGNYSKARRLMLMALSKNRTDWKTWRGILSFELLRDRRLRLLLKRFRR